MIEFRIGIIGLGRISTKHFQAIAKLDSRARVVAVADLKVDRLYGLGPDVRLYESGQKLIEFETEIDLLVILTDSGSHYELCRAAISMKTPVLVEKPLALSFGEAKWLVESYERAQIPLFVVKQNRLNPAVRSMFSELESGSIGKVNMVLSNVLWCRTPEYYLADPWRMSKETDGGVIWNQASHYVDLITLILGSVEEVYAVGQNYLSPADSFDSVSVIMKGESGAVGNLVATTSVRPRNFEGSVTVIGEFGLLRVDGHALNKFSNSNSPSTVNPNLELSEDRASDVYGESHSLVYESLFNHLRDGMTSEFTARNTLSGVKLMEAIDESIYSGKPVGIAQWQ